MSISSINGVGAYSVTAAETESKAAKAAETTDKQVKEDAAVFEKSQDTKKDSANQIYNRDNVIAKLKADQQSGQHEQSGTEAFRKAGREV